MAAPQAVANTLGALADLGVVPGPGWLDGVVEGSVELLGLMNAKEMGTLLRALGVMRYELSARWLHR